MNIIQAFIGNLGTCSMMLTEKQQVEELHKSEIWMHTVGADETVVVMKLL